jgi:hypothetical protein
MPRSRQAWTEKWAQRETHKRLKKIEALLVDIGGIWGDVDQYIVNRADEAISLMREIGVDVDEQIAAKAIEREAE